MTREQAKSLLPVIQAFADGKDVQVRVDGGQWITRHSKEVPYLNFDNESWEWRVKPQPREWWIIQFSNGVTSVHNNKSITESFINSVNPSVSEIIHVREVVE